LLNQAKSRPDKVVVSRFRRLCQMLERHRDCFETAQFATTPATVPDTDVALPRTPYMATGRRYAEQMWRYTYG
jgi:phosphohistidine phosphatase SixA